MPHGNADFLGGVEILENVITTVTPIDTKNGRIITLQKPPIKSYATFRKVAYVALDTPFKRIKIRIFYIKYKNSIDETGKKC